MKKLVPLTKSTIKDPKALSEMDNLQKILNGTHNNHDIDGLEA